MPVKIGSLQFDATINFDSIAAESAAQLGKEIADGVAEGTAAVNQQQDVIFEVIDAYKQMGDVVAKTFDISKGSFDKLSDAEIARQEEWLRMTEARGTIMTQEQTEWLTMAEERRTKLRDEVEMARSRRMSSEGGTAAPEGPTRNPINLLGSDFTNTLKEAYQGYEDLDKTSQKYYQSIGQLEQRLTEVKAAQKALTKEQDAGKLTTDEFKNAYASLAQQEEMLINTMDILTNSQKAHESAMGVEDGSLAHKKILLEQLEQQWEDLASAEFISSEQGKTMLKSIQDLKVEIDGMDVGKLSKTADEGVKATTRLNELRNQLADMKPGDLGYDKLKEEATDLATRINNVNKELKLQQSNTSGLDAMNVAVRGVIGGFTALQGVIGLVSDDNKELQKTLLVVTSAMSVLQGVQEFSSAIAKAGGLNQYLLSITMKGTTAAAVEQTAATVELTAAQSAETAVTAAQATVTTGAAVAATEMAVAETAQAVATGAAAVATEGLTAAMLANPATVLLVALTAIVGAIYAFVSSSKDASEEQIKVNEALAQGNELIAKLAELYNETYREATRRAENAIALAGVQRKSEMEIFDLRQKALEAKRQENIALLSSKGYNLSVNNEVEKGLGMLKAELEMRTLEAQGLVHLLELNKKLTDTDEERLKLLQTQIKTLEAQYQSIKGASDTIKQTNAEEVQLAAEKEKKIADNALTSASDTAEARHILARKNTKAELDATIDTIRKRQAVELNDPNLTPGAKEKINATANKAIIDANRQFAILQLNNDKSLLQEQLSLAEKGSAAELDIKKKLISKQADIDQKAEGVTAEKGKEIRGAMRKANEELDRSFRVKTLNDQKSEIKAQLAAVKEGSGAELQLKQEMINKQLEIEEAAEGVSASRKKELEAEAQKAITELIKKFALENSEAIINTRISAINEELALVEKGSERELQLKKDLIDEKTALDILSARSRIKNEDQLAAKIKQINSNANVGKRKEDNDFSDRQVDKIIRKIDADAKKLNGPLEKIVSDPFATAGEKYKAQLQILQNNLVAYTLKQKALEDQIKAGVGDIGAAKQKLDEINNSLAETNNQIDNLTKNRLADVFKGIADDLNKVGSSLQSLGSAIEETNQGLGDTLSTMGQIASAAGSLASAVSSFASGNIIGGVVSTISFVVGLFSIGAKARASERKAMEDIAKFQLQILAGEIETNIQYRERLRIQVLINKTKLDGLKAEADLLSKQRKDSLAEYTRIFGLLQSEQFVTGEHTEKYGGFLGIGRKTRAVQDLASLAGKSFADLERLFNSGQLTDHAKDLFIQLQKLKQEGADIDQQLLDIQQQAKELYTGTTADNITDSIIEGFKNGYRSMSDFADNFEELMRTAVLNSLKYKTLEPALKDFYDQFASFSQSGDVLTADEIEKLRKLYGDIIDKTSKQFANLQQITSLNLSGAGGDGNSLKGAIKGITEQQAALLAGQFGGLRITAIETLKINTEALKELQNITYNTSFIELSHRIWRDIQLNGVKIK